MGFHAGIIWVMAGAQHTVELQHHLSFIVTIAPFQISRVLIPSMGGVRDIVRPQNHLGLVFQAMIPGGVTPLPPIPYVRMAVARTERGASDENHNWDCTVLAIRGGCYSHGINYSGGWIKRP